MTRLSNCFHLAAKALFLVPLILTATPSAARIEPLDRIVAVVNEDVITESELHEEIRTILLQLREKNTRLPPQNVIERQVLERLIVKRLQLQLAATTGITVDDDTLNQALRQIAKSNHLSLSEFREVLEGDGFSFEKFRENIRDEIAISRLRNREVENRVTVSDQEIGNFQESQGKRGALESQQFHLAHILITLPEAASPEQIQAARDKAVAVLDDLREGVDFREKAFAVSDGQQAFEGGDLGWRKLGQVPTLFVEVVQAMEVGEISDLIRSPSGFHIIKLLEIRGDERRMITQTKVRHILISTNEMTSDDDAIIRLEQLKARIEGGEDFATLARAHSDDKGSAIQGGELGWVDPSSMVSEFEDVMNRMPAEEVCAPFRTQYGWHILQVMARREHDSTEEFKRTQAREEIRKRKVEEDLELWLRRLRDEAYVEYRLEE